MTRIVLARFCLSAAQLVESRSAEDMPCVTRGSSRSLRFRSHSARCESLNDAVLYDTPMHSFSRLTAYLRGFDGIFAPYSPVPAKTVHTVPKISFQSSQKLRSRM